MYSFLYWKCPVVATAVAAIRATEIVTDEKKDFILTFELVFCFLYPSGTRLVPQPFISSTHGP